MDVYGYENIWNTLKDIISVEGAIIKGKKNKGFENEMDILCTQRCNIFAIRKVRKKNVT